jgi:hypothetical protein
VVVPDMMKGYAVSADALLKPPEGLLNSLIHKTKFMSLAFGAGRAILSIKPEEVMKLGDAVLNDLRNNYGIKSIGVHGTNADDFIV